MTKFDLTGRKALVTGGRAGPRRGHGPGARRGRRHGGDRRPAGRRRHGRRRQIAETDGEHGFVAPRRHRRRRLGGRRSPRRSSSSAASTSWSTTPASRSPRLVVDIDAGRHPHDARRQRRSARRSGIKHACARCAPAAPPARAARSSTSPRSPRPSPSPASRSTRPPSRPSTGSPGSRRMESGKLGYGVRVNCVYPGLVPTAMGAGWPTTWPSSACSRSAEAAVGAVDRADAVGPAGRGRRHGRRRGVPGLRRRPLHQRRGPAGRRRHGHVTATSDAPAAKPVVVYGASGYTGRLVCEYLREYGIPFIAAGRNADKVHAAMEPTSPASRPPTTRWSRSSHTVEALTELFKRRVGRAATRSGPFAKFGPEVVEACLAAGATTPTPPASRTG